MKVLLEIKDSKAEFVMELLGNLPYVKTKKLSEAKAKKLLDDLKASIDEVKLERAGKKKLKSLNDALNEL